MADQSILSTKKINELSLELYKLSNEFKTYEQNYKNRKEEIQSQIMAYTKKKGINEFSVVSPLGNIKVHPVVNKKIIWDVDKLKTKLDNDVFNEVIKKDYKINDMNGLIRYLKSCGVNPNKFKTYIDISQKVDNEKINELSEVGEITEKDIKGCYRIEYSSGYIKFSELDGD